MDAGGGIGSIGIGIMDEVSLDTISQLCAGATDGKSIMPLFSCKSDIPAAVADSVFDGLFAPARHPLLSETLGPSDIDACPNTTFEKHSSPKCSSSSICSN